MSSRLDICSGYVFRVMTSIVFERPSRAGVTNAHHGVHRIGPLTGVELFHFLMHFLPQFSKHFNLFHNKLANKLPASRSFFILPERHNHFAKETLGQSCD